MKLNLKAVISAIVFSLSSFSNANTPSYESKLSPSYSTQEVDLRREFEGNITDQFTCQQKEIYSNSTGRQFVIENFPRKNWIMFVHRKDEKCQVNFEYNPEEYQILRKKFQQIKKGQISSESYLWLDKNTLSLINYPAHGYNVILDDKDKNGDINEKDSAQIQFPSNLEEKIEKWIRMTRNKI